MKLSCRSAKDSLAPSVLRTWYETFMRASQANSTATSTFTSTSTSTTTTTAAAVADQKTAEATECNARLIALVKAATAVMRVHSAADALQMVIASDRIFEDLNMGKLAAGDGWAGDSADFLCFVDFAAFQNPSRFLQNIIVRQWVNIEVDMEWRGFVFNSTLNALSQYNHVTYFPRLGAMKDSVGARILQFFNAHVKQRLAAKGYSNYVIDFALSGAALDKVWVIEVLSSISAAVGAQQEAGLFSQLVFRPVFCTAAEPVAARHRLRSVLLQNGARHSPVQRPV